MTDPTNVLGTKILRQAQIAEKLRPELEKDAAKLAMFDELLDALEKCTSFLSGWSMSPQSRKEIDNLIARAGALQK